MFSVSQGQEQSVLQLSGHWELSGQEYQHWLQVTRVRQSDRQTDRQTERQSDRQTDRQTDRQSGRQKDSIKSYQSSGPSSGLTHLLLR